MPDTVFSPSNAFEVLIDKMNSEHADLVLGVFPTDEPEHFAPVEFDNSGRVIITEDKPIAAKFNNTWGIALWTAEFWNFF